MQSGFPTQGDELANLVDLRNRLRELTDCHLASLEPFHFQGTESCLSPPSISQEAQVRNQARPLSELTHDSVALRGFSRVELDGTSGDRNQIKLISTAAVVRSILRDPEVDHRNLQLEELILEYFSRFTTSDDATAPAWEIGVSGLPAWNFFTTGQVLDLLTKLVPIMDSQLVGQSDGSAHFHSLAFDPEHQRRINTEFTREHPPTPHELTGVVEIIRTMTVHGRIAVRNRRVAQLQAEAQLLPRNPPPSSRDWESLRFKHRLHDFCRSIDRNSYLESILFAETPGSDTGPFATANGEMGDLRDAFHCQNLIDRRCGETLASIFLEGTPNEWGRDPAWPDQTKLDILDQEMKQLEDSPDPILSSIERDNEVSLNAIKAARLALWVMIGAFSSALVERVDKSLALEPSAQPLNWRVAYERHGFTAYWVASGIESTRAFLNGLMDGRYGAELRVPETFLGEIDKKHKLVAEVAMEELLRQLALQAADDQDADPYQLGYHLCTVARSATQVQNELLSHSLAKLFEFLRQDGTFARGNPVWSSDRGEFHCLTAELLAHTVISFKPRHRNLLVRELPHLERAVDWLEDHCIERIDRSRVRRQWSTGSRVGSFPGPDPDKRVRLSDLAESRSTSITYSFFHLLDHLLSDEINAAVFHRFGATYPTSPRANSGALSNSNLYGSTEVARSGQTLRPRVNEVIQRFLCDELKTVYTELPGYTLTDWADKQRKVRSVMLFGPPGTGKSTLAKGCAKYLGWPFLVLDPSVFSSLGLEMVPQRSIEVFRDLAELENVVLLFDEMDELIRERKSKADDRETDTPTTWYVQRLWTTVFLPRLQELHDRAGTVFFFATNFEKAEVDEAVRRPGRFDILMAMPHATRADKKTFLSKTLRSALSLECDRLARAIDSSESQKREECRVAKNTAVTWDVWLGALTNGDVRAYCDELLRVEVGTVGENNVWKTLFEAAHYVIPESAKDSSDYDFEANRFPPSVARSVFEEDRSEWGL